MRKVSRVPSTGRGTRDDAVRQCAGSGDRATRIDRLRHVDAAPLELLALLFSALLLAALVAALLIAVTLFARSLKEAQSYVAPLGLILVLPVVGLQFSDFLPQSPLLYGLPAFGTLLLLNDTVRGDFDPRLAAWAWGSSLLLAALLLWFALRSFRKEDVLFRT